MDQEENLDHPGLADPVEKQDPVDLLVQVDQEAKEVKVDLLAHKVKLGQLDREDHVVKLDL